MRGEATHRRRLAVGIGISVAVHAVALAVIQLGPAAVAEAHAARSPRDAAVERFTERPIQVIEIRQAPAARSASTASAAAAPAARAATLPLRASVPTALAAATPVPRLLLEKVTAREDSAATVRYASVEDLLLSRAPEQGRLRPIDDRPVEVLAAIARSEGRSRGPGIVIGGLGGSCE